MATLLKDIAEKYHISVATLSRVINDKGNVHPKTQARVKEILEREHYVPNNIARSLRTSSTGTIGIIIPDIGQKLFNRIIHGIERKMSEKGYLILLSDTNNNEEKENRYLDLMARQCVDGVVVALNDSIHFSRAKLERLCNQGIPIVYIDTLPIGMDKIDAVLTDDYQAGQKMARYLMQLGHTQFAVLTGIAEGLTPSAQRLAGFTDYCAAQGAPVAPELMCKLQYNEEDAYNVMLRMLENRDETHFTAVACMHELMTLGVIKAIRQFGLQIGSDISLIGCDLNERVQLMTPQITCIEQQEEQIGEKVASLLLKRLEQKQRSGTDAMAESYGEKILLAPELNIRESCKRL